MVLLSRIQIFRVNKPVGAGFVKTQVLIANQYLALSASAFIKSGSEVDVHYLSLSSRSMVVLDPTFDLTKFQECFEYVQSSLKWLLASDRAR